MWEKARAVGNVYSRCPRVVPVRAVARIVHMSTALVSVAGAGAGARLAQPALRVSVCLNNSWRASLSSSAACTSVSARASL